MDRRSLGGDDGLHEIVKLELHPLIVDGVQDTDDLDIVGRAGARPLAAIDDVGQFDLARSSPSGVMSSKKKEMSFSRIRAMFISWLALMRSLPELVFLHLLERDSELLAQRTLRNSFFDPGEANTCSEVTIDRMIFPRHHDL